MSDARARAFVERGDRRLFCASNDLGNTLLLGHLQVNVGRYRDGPPSATAGSGAQSLQKNGDIMTTIDRPTFAGVRKSRRASAPAQPL